MSVLRVKNKGDVVPIAPRLPYSQDAELAVLGAVILDNRAFDEASILKENDFFLPQHRVIFKMMSAMLEQAEPIDLISLPEKLHAAKKLEEAGGVHYVTSLADGRPKISSTGHYANIVRQKAMLRRIIEIGNSAQLLAFEDSDSGEEIADQAMQGLMEIATEYAKAKLLGKTSRQARISLLQSLEAKENLLRINTGIPELDTATGGFRAGELITITASLTGAGKTLFAQQIRSNACKEGNHGLYFSGEMAAEQLASREIATDAGVPHWKMRRPEKLTEEEYSALFSHAAHECDICRIIDGEFSIRDIRIACRRMKRVNALKWAVIDYDELVDAPGKDEFAQQRIVIREAKRIAVTCEIPVFVISGIRKPLDKNEAKKPTLERIYGSGAKSKHSSFVLFVDREYVRELKGDQTKARICILKARDGKIGEIAATFDLQTLRFRAETEEEEYLRRKKKGGKDAAGGEES